MKIRVAAGFALGFAIAAPLTAADVAAFSLPVARFGAMGGSHAALDDDYSLLFANPAALDGADPRFFAAQVGARATGPLFDIAQAFIGGGSLIGNFITVLAANDYRLYAAADVAGPLSFGYVGRGIGFGLFNRTSATVDASSISSVRLGAWEDVLLIGGYAFGIDLGTHHRLQAGILAKGFARGGVAKTTDALSLMNVVADPLGLAFSLTTGIGVDVGLRWEWSAGLSAGLACRDLYSPVLVSSYSSVQGFLDDPKNNGTGSEDAEIARDLAFGLAWTMQPGGLWGIVDGLVIAIDYNHILDVLEPFPRNPILNLGIGMEARILDIVALRAGIGEGYPNAGVSLDLSVMRLNVSFLGSELGREPGSRPAFNLMTSLEFVY